MGFRIKLERRIPKIKPLKILNPDNPIISKVSILGMDTGAKNFAVCHVKDNRVYGTAMLRSPIFEIKMKSFEVIYNAFIKEISHLIWKTRPKIIVGERFLPRKFAIKAFELISAMLHIIARICQEKSIIFASIPAPQWKIAIRKWIDLDGLYKTAKKDFQLPPHIVDAMCIAKFSLNKNSFSQKDSKWILRNLKNCKKGI